MAEIVTMPRLSDTMTEGVVAKWHKQVGDTVSEGDLLAEIETDKATMEFESFQEGVLLHIGVEEGGKAPVDTILAILGEKDEDVNSILKEYEKNTEKEESGPKEEKKEVKEEAPKTATPSVPKTVESKAVATTILSSPSNGGEKASPLAKKLAEERNINLSSIKGTGDGGRIVKRDIDNYSGGNVPAVERYTEVPVSQMRGVIAQRLAESKFAAPHFYLTVEIDMVNAFDARQAINSVSPVKVSFNDMIVKATSMSLQQHPEINSSWQGDTIRYNEHIHIGVAMAVEDGLLVPVVRFADTKRLSQIAAEVKNYGALAKTKKLKPEDWQGNTFTISNLGMFNIEEFTAIINPPDACILAVGGIIEKPVVKNGQIVVGKTMKVTLSCDHRVVDGVIGSKFLATLKNYLENPVLFMGSQSI
ncbi:MAG: dihydrolipoamide acyltransferase [Flavobacteriales bacterium]|nr:dihydrolipoamide acyltransferase [Flavobacteriales bacterium]|tara:strand:- start:35188 stop:36441 length:1254 start_codon:yes stop_codon:yes gene_type:complete